MPGAHERREVIRMRANGPLILAVLFVAGGLGVVFYYGVGTAGFNAAYPLAGASLQLSIATAGPAAAGGLALLALGLLIMAWALICALAGLFTPATNSQGHLARMEQKNLDREQILERKRLEKEEKQLDRENRLRASYPKN